MNYLVFLDAGAGELEKILSGVKTMLLKEFDPANSNAYPVNPGDNLYFLRDKEAYEVCVKATVLRVLIITNRSNEDLAYNIKEMQPKLQLTEDQYNDWSEKGQALLVEFDCAQKIGLIQVDRQKFLDCSDWVAFEEITLIT